MSSVYAVQDPVLAETQYVQNVARRGLLQLTALDFLAIENLRIFKDNLYQFGGYTPGDSSVPGMGTTVLPDLIPNPDNDVPYQIPSATLLFITRPHSHLDGSAKLRPYFQKYTISLFIQQLWSYALNNTRSLCESRWLTSDDIGDVTPSDGSDRLTPQELTYRLQILEEKITDQLVNANSGNSSIRDVSDVLIDLITAFGILNPPDPSATPPSNDLPLGADDDLTGIESSEENLEEELAYHLFDHSMDVSKSTGSNIEHEAGLERVINDLLAILPTQISGTMNSGVFSKILNIWQNLFSSEGQPEMANTLLDTLPTIQGVFTATTPYTSQQDISSNGQQLMTDFLTGTVTDGRLNALQNLVNASSPSLSLDTFRSLDDVDPKMLTGMLGGKHGNPENIPWDAAKDGYSRLSYMYTLWWSLQTQSDLSDLFSYALDVPPAGKKLSDYNITRSGTIPNATYSCNTVAIIPPAMFSGTLDGTQNGMMYPPGGGVPLGYQPQPPMTTLDLNYNGYIRNLEREVQTLQQPGQLLKDLKSAGLRWLE